MRFKRVTWLAAFCFAALAAQALAADSLESELLADAADGRLDDFTLCEAAAIAGGCRSREEVTLHLARFDDLCVSSAEQTSTADPPRERAEILLSCLHREILTGPYQADQWQVVQTLEDGRYNCLTATILYQCLCRRFGLPADAVSYPGHVACRVNSLVVETTSARWIEHPIAAGHQLSDVQLLAKVYYNRSLALLAKGQYAPAAACLAACRRLDPLDASARENELAAWNNWALTLAASGRFEEASLRIHCGLALDPTSPRLLESAAYIQSRATKPGN